MKKFVGLLKREDMLNSTHLYVVLALIILAISLVPIGIERYNPMHETEQNRFIIVLACAVMVGANAVFMTIASINRDIKIKELWLHNTQSIYKLVGVKVIYQLIALLLIGLINFCGLFFVGDIVEGTFSQFIVLAAMYLYILAATFILIVIFVIFYNSLLKQLVAWFGKLGNVIGFIGLFVFLSFSGNETASIPALKIGYVSFSNLEERLPTFNDANITLNMMFDFYILEELILLVIFTLLYIVACKWLERVITR